MDAQSKRFSSALHERPTPESSAEAPPRPGTRRRVWHGVAMSSLMLAARELDAFAHLMVAEAVRSCSMNSRCRFLSA